MKHIHVSVNDLQCHVILLNTVEFTVERNRTNVYLLCCAYAGSCVGNKTEADVTEHNDKPRPYVCTVCDKRFIEKCHLIQHSEIHKGDENMYSCTQCEKSFTTRRYLAYHMNVHKGKYKCTECGMCFINNGVLRDHQRSHSQEKPFDRVPHSQEKRFECTVCRKRFAVSRHLVRHSRIHSGEKPYKCLECDRAFSRSESLRLHMKVHMKDELNIQASTGTLWFAAFVM